MRKAAYIFSFVILGILVQFLIHALVEIWYVGLLLRDFPRYGLGLSWNAWLLMHHIGTVILSIAGAAAGFWQGKYWWRKKYD